MRFDLSLLSLRPFTEAELMPTYTWLNEPEMQDITMTQPFTKEQQLSWFKGLPGRNDFIVKALYAGDKLIGAWGLKNINWEEKHAEPYYYIGDQTYQGRGIGEWLMIQSIEACEERGLEKIIAIMYAKNFRIVNLHFKQGFKINKYQDGLYYMEKSI